MQHLRCSSSVSLSSLAESLFAECCLFEPAPSVCKHKWILTIIKWLLKTAEWVNNQILVIRMLYYCFIISFWFKNSCNKSFINQTCSALHWENNDLWSFSLSISLCLIHTLSKPTCRVDILPVQPSGLANNIELHHSTQYQPHVSPHFTSATCLCFEPWLVHCIVFVLCDWLEW